MNTYFILTLCSAVICFLVPAITYNIATKKGQVFNRPHSVINTIFLPMFAALLICTLGGFYFLYDANSFISSLNVIQTITPVIGAILIYLSGYSPKFSKYTWIIILICSLAVALTASDANLTFIPDLNLWLSRGLVFALCFIFSYAYRYTNSGDGMLSVQSLAIICGIGVLSMVNALPVFIGFMAWISLASFVALLSFTWYPSRVKISPTAASAFGFLIFGLMAFSSYEGCGPCVLIFSMFMLIDVLWALAYKLTFISKYNNIMDNTGYRRALEEGMNPSQAAAFSFRIQILLIFFGVFQAYSPNPLSLVLLCAVITTWLCYKFRNVPTAAQSLKNINLQVIEELQERVKDIKDIVNRDEES